MLDVNVMVELELSAPARQKNYFVNKETDVQTSRQNRNIGRKEMSQ